MTTYTVYFKTSEPVLNFDCNIVESGLSLAAAKARYQEMKDEQMRCINTDFTGGIYIDN